MFACKQWPNSENITAKQNANAQPAQLYLAQGRGIVWLNSEKRLIGAGPLLNTVQDAQRGIGNHLLVERFPFG